MADAEKVGNNVAADANTAASYYAGENNNTTSSPSTWTSGATAASNNYSTAPATATWGPSPYTNYASMYAGFFCLLVYTTIYLTVVEKCFSLIYLLPDQVLRWIGGSPESWGKETAQWSEATKKEVEGASKETSKAAQKTVEGGANYLGLGKSAKGDDSKGGVSGQK